MAKELLELKALKRDLQCFYILTGRGDDHSIVPVCLAKLRAG
jgi:hypothetical protein